MAAPGTPNAALIAAKEELLSAAARIKALTEEKTRTAAQLLALQRAVSEAQRVGAERSEALEHLREELAAASSVTDDAESRVAAKLDAAARELKAEREKAAAVDLAHNAAVAAAVAAAGATERELRAALAGSAAEAAKERERVAELQRSVEHLTRAGEEAKELWARLKEALLVRHAALHCCHATPRRCPASPAALIARMPPAFPRLRSPPRAPSRASTCAVALPRRRTCGRRQWAL
jgi:hypothetical protein